MRVGSYVASPLPTSHKRCWGLLGSRLKGAPLHLDSTHLLRETGLEGPYGIASTQPIPRAMLVTSSSPLLLSFSFAKGKPMLALCFD
jgi:hypothetical protein